MAKKETKKAPLEIRNRKASHDFFVGETFEAGIVLTGTEIKSLRAGHAQINDAFVRVDRGEAIMYQSHISEYDFGNINNHNPTRQRKLLLHKKEILKLFGKSKEDGLTIIPLEIYMSGSRAKMKIALAKGKKLYDKRDSEAEKSAKRNMERAIKETY